MECFKRECAAFFAACDLTASKPLVFGEGPEKPVLMLIGEAPGEQEALQGHVDHGEHHEHCHQHDQHVEGQGKGAEHCPEQSNR